MRIKNVVLFSTAALIGFFTNCAQEVPPGGTSTGGSGGAGQYKNMRVSPTSQTITDCSNSTARLQESVIGGGPSIKACLIINGSGNCTSPANFAAINNPNWIYTPGTDTWASNIALQNNQSLVPGFYEVHIRSSDGLQERIYTYSIATQNAASPTTCNAPGGGGSAFSVTVNTNSIPNCSDANARLTVTVANGGAGLKGCVEVDGGTDCASGTGYVTMAANAEWVYTAASDTWVMNFLTRGPIAYPNPGWWIRPGTFRWYFKKADGTVQGPKTVTVATTSANGCSP